MILKQCEARFNNVSYAVNSFDAISCAPSAAHEKAKGYVARLRLRTVLTVVLVTLIVRTTGVLSQDKRQLTCEPPKLPCSRASMAPRSTGRGRIDHSCSGFRPPEFGQYISQLEISRRRCSWIRIWGLFPVVLLPSLAITWLHSLLQIRRARPRES